jgi:hypothetical protein
VDSRDCLHYMVKRKLLTLPGLELRPLSQSLYRLRYRGSYNFRVDLQIDTVGFCENGTELNELHKRLGIPLLPATSHIKDLLPIVISI